MHMESRSPKSISAIRYSLRKAAAFIATVAAIVASTSASAQVGAPHSPAAVSSSAIDVPTAEKSSSALAISVVSIDTKEGVATIRFTLPRAGIIRMTLMSADGKEAGVLASGLSKAGENVVDIDIERITPGEYRCVLQTRDGNVSARLILTR